MANVENSEQVQVHATEQSVLNPSDFDGLLDVDMAISNGNTKRPHISRYGNSLARASKDAKRVNLFEKIKGKHIGNALQRARCGVSAKSDDAISIGRHSRSSVI